MEAVDTLIARLRSTDDDDERDDIKAEIVALSESIGRSPLREYVENALKDELLEVQWELEEVVETLTPPKQPSSEPEPEPEPEPVDDPTTRALRPSEIELVYDDPRGLRIYKSKVDDRWVVSQIDPRVGQPVTYEIPGAEADRIKQQLAGSPYWLKEV